MSTLVDIIGKYMQVATAPFLKQPESAQLFVATSPEGDTLRVRLVLDRSDVAYIIGRNGMTASAIRSLAKSAGERYNTRVIVHILSQEEAAEQDDS